MPANEFPFPLVTLNIFEFQIYIPEAESMKAIYQQQQMDFPFWSRIWPSAMAISAWIQENPQLISGFHIMEIGAGIGLPSFVSSKYANKIITTDQQQYAVELLKSNIQLNKINNITALKLDWRYDPIMPADVYILSDVNYDPDSFDPLKIMIEGIMDSGAKILLSTPQRITAVAFVDYIKSYILSQHVREVDGVVISLYHLEKNKIASSDLP